MPASNPYEQEVLADLPVAFFTMGEASGNITDLVAAKSGTANGTPTYGVAGPIPGVTAISFDNLADFFSVADHADFDLAVGSSSIEFWVSRITDTGATQAVLSKGTSPNGYLIAILSADNMVLDRPGLGGYIVGESGTTAAGSGWIHFVFTRTGTGAGNTLVYKNGVEGHTDSQPAEAWTDTATALEIGRETSAANSINGALAYIAIYKSILSAARVQVHFDARNWIVPRATPFPQLLAH